MNTVATKPLSEEEKKALIKDLLGQNFQISGQNMVIMSKVIDYIGRVDTAYTLGELLPKLGAILSGSRFFSAVGSGASVLSIFLFPIDSMIKVINAWQTGHRLYSYRAVAYAITAWTYNLPQPSASPTIIRNVQINRHTDPIKTIPEYHAAWKKSADSTVKMMKQESLKNNLQEAQMKLILQAISDGKPDTLCDLLLKGLAEKLNAIEKLSWQSNYTIRYPN